MVILSGSLLQELMRSHLLAPVPRVRCSRVSFARLARLQFQLLMW